MPITNTVYSNDAKIATQIAITNDRVSLDDAIMSTETEKQFNTYRYWEPFDMQLDNVIKDGSSKTKNGNPKLQRTSGKGVKSLFNNSNGVFIYSGYNTDRNAPVLDSPETRKEQRRRMACTIKDLVDASASGEMGRQIYSYADFAYCKYLGKLPNNYLITLRRFGAPCGDKIDIRRDPTMMDMEKNIQNHASDVGRLVTWMGTPGNEISNILKFNVGMNWQELKAESEEVNMQGEGGGLASLFNMANGTYRQQVMQGRAGTNYAGKEYMDKLLGGGSEPPYKDLAPRDKNKVYGPVDAITSVMKRDIGLKFEQKFTITFDYELRSYYGINGRAAMLDLLANILAVTYNHGILWGGERRFYGGFQDNIFANLPIFKLAQSGGLNDVGAVHKALIDSLHQGAQAFSQGTKGETTKEKILNLAKDIGGMLLGGMLNKLGRPQRIAMNSLLTDAPTGCWHLTVGNPKSPIIEVGNLIMESAEIEQYGPLGMDDFPTGLRVKVNLSHGKPRDVVGIEQMFNRGDSRLYSPLGEKVLDMYKNAQTIGGGNSITQKQQNNVNKSQTDAGQSEQDTALAPIKVELAKPMPASTPPDSFYSLMRNFGTTEQAVIASGSAEALYGASPNPQNHEADELE